GAKSATTGSSRRAAPRAWRTGRALAAPGADAVARGRAGQILSAPGDALVYFRVAIRVDRPSARVAGSFPLSAAVSLASGARATSEGNSRGRAVVDARIRAHAGPGPDPGRGGHARRHRARPGVRHQPWRRA